MRVKRKARRERRREKRNGRRWCGEWCRTRAACGEAAGRRYCAHSSVSLGSLPSPLVLSVLALPTRKFFPELVFCGLKGCSRPPDALPRGEEFPRGTPATGNARVSAGVCGNACAVVCEMLRGVYP